MWSISYAGRRLTDAPALFGAITRWIGPRTRPDLRSFSELDCTQAGRLFAGRGVLQMVPERGDRIARVATAVRERWAGGALHLVEEAGWDGPGVVELLATTIPGYEDEATVGGRRLRFRKLAHLASSLMAHGVVGLVMDAGVRDTLDLRAMRFAVWSRHVSCEGTVKNTPGSVNVPISINGVIIEPGDVVCADDDGVVAVPRTEAGWALEQSNARLENETVTRARLQAGELGLDTYGLRQQLIDLGGEWIE